MVIDIVAVSGCDEHSGINDEHRSVSAKSFGEDLIDIASVASRCGATDSRKRRCAAGWRVGRGVGFRQMCGDFIDETMRTDPAACCLSVESCGEFLDGYGHIGSVDRSPLDHRWCSAGPVRLRGRPCLWHGVTAHRGAPHPPWPRASDRLHAVRRPAPRHQRQNGWVARRGRPPPQACCAERWTRSPKRRPTT